MLWLAEALDWGKEFRAFTLYHAAVLGVSAVVMAGAWLIGLRLRGSPHEDRFRVRWGWLVLIYKVGETVHDCWPGRFDIMDSLPLQICDLAAFAAAGAMITQKRMFHTLLYFWGLGLSPQAAFMPTLQSGYLSIDFWFFWTSHTMVIGSATYDLIVKSYHPTLRDTLLAMALTVGYALVVTAVNLSCHVDYGYIGNPSSGIPPAIEALGPWPLRAFKVCIAVGAVFLVMWAIWPIAMRLVRTAARRKA